MRTTTKAPVPDTLKAKALLVNDRLCEEYGAPIPFFNKVEINHPDIRLVFQG